jgi:threonine/homoserine/homoserine lactone efflux protein
MIRGYFITPYTFQGKPAFYTVLWLVGGALLAFFGSLTVFKAGRSRRA